MSQESLNKTLAVGAIWVTALRLAYRLIGLLSTIILARLLTPDDFGVAAIAMSVFALINTFTQLGFDTVLIQKKNPDADYYNTAWTFNLIFGALAAGTLFGLSSRIGGFYENQDLVYITMVISLLFLLHGIRNVGVVDFQKNMTFDREFKLLVIPKFISFFCTIALAVYYQNYWALVIGNVVWKLLEVANSYIMHPFRPSISFGKSSELFGFSKWLMANNAFNFVNNKSPELVLGKLISPHAAAIFTLASEIAQMSTSEVISNLNRAIYPGYSRLSGDLVKLRDLFGNSVRVIAFIAMPLGAGVALTSKYIVPLLLGDQWGEAIEPLVYLSLGFTVFALRSNVSYIYYSLGIPRVSTAELFLRTIVFVGLMFWLIEKNGVVGAAQAFLLASILISMVSCIVVAIVLKVSIWQQVRLYLKPLLATLAMSLFVYGYLNYLALDRFFIDLVLAVLLGVAVYFLSVLMLWLLSGRKDGIEKHAIRFIRSKLKI